MTSRCSDRLLGSRAHSQLLLWTGTGELPISPALQTKIHLELAIKGRSERIGYDVQLANSNMDHCASTLIDCTFFFSRWTRWACSCCVTSISMEHDLSRPIPGQIAISRLGHLPGQIAGDRSPHAGALALAQSPTSRIHVHTTPSPCSHLSRHAAHILLALPGRARSRRDHSHLTSTLLHQLSGARLAHLCPFCPLAHRRAAAFGQRHVSADPPLRT